MNEGGQRHPWLPNEIELRTDLSAADWVVSGLQPWDKDEVRVASFMVEGFDGYARVLHPAGDRGGEARGLRWAEVASRLGVRLLPDSQFRQIVGDGDLYRHPLLGDIEPDSGSLPQSVLHSFVTFLRGWTDDEEPCWYAMWEGNGSWWKRAHSGDDPFDDERDEVLINTPRVQTPGRAYFLMRGPLGAVVPLFVSAGRQSPALWWPQSRSWLVSTEVDAFSTYVGGSAGLIQSLLQSEEIEAVPSAMEAPLDWGI